LPVLDGFTGLCTGKNPDIFEGSSKARRRRFTGANLVLGQGMHATSGITTPHGKADSFKLYMASLSARDGSCPLPNDKCVQHRCACTPTPKPTGAECGKLADGCGSTMVFQYSGPLGSAAAGACPASYACNATYKCEKSQFPSIENLRKCMSRDSANIATRLSKFYSFRDGTRHNKISDGGNDMYDGGNMIQVKGSRTSSVLDYTNQCATVWKKTMVDDIEYFTCKISKPVTVWFAGFRSVGGNIKGIKVTGNLGADGSGSTSSGKTSVWPHGKLFGYFKEVYGTRDPSINHLVMVPDDSWTNTFPADTNNDLHEVAGSGVNMMFYALFAGYDSSKYRSHQYTQADYEKIMNEVVSSC